MNEAVSPQHPAVVLRSHYQHVRALLAVAMVAVVGLAVAVVILATTRGSGSTRAHVSTSSSAATSTWRPGNTRYDGGPEEGSLFATPPARNPAYDYNGGHDEGKALSGAAVHVRRGGYVLNAPSAAQRNASTAKGGSTMSCRKDYSKNSATGDYCVRRVIAGTHAQAGSRP